MKFKKSVLIVICALLCATTLLCSCDVENAGSNSVGGWIMHNDNYVNPASVAFTAEKAEQHELATGKSVELNEYCDLFIEAVVTEPALYADNGTDYTQKITTYIYSAETKEEIFKHEGYAAVSGIIFTRCTVSINYSTGGAFIVKETTTKTGEDTKYNKTLYDANGEKIDSDATDADTSFYDGSYAVIGQNVYRAKDGTVTKAFDTEYIPLSMLSNFEAEHGKYMYGSVMKAVYGSNEYKSQIIGINVYEDYKVKHTYDIPSYAEDTRWYVLNNGKVLIQYSVLLDPDTTEYDYEELNKEGLDFSKYDLVSIIWDVEANKTTQANLDFIVASLTSKASAMVHDYGKALSETEEKYVYSDSLDNLAFITPIIDKKLDNVKSSRFVIVDNSLNVKFNMSEIVENQKDGNGITIIGKNLYMVTLNSGEIWMINGWGTRLYRLPASMLFINDKYVVSDNYIYSVSDKGLSAVLDMHRDGYALEDCNNNNTAILKKQNTMDGITEYYTFNLLAEESAPVKITPSTDGEFHIQALLNQYFTTWSESILDRKYTLYSLSGEALATSDSEFTKMLDMDDLLVVSTTNASGKTVLHVFKK